MCNREDWQEFGGPCTALIAVCGCCIGTIFLVALFSILILSSSATIESGSIFVGDALGDSSALFEVNSPTVVMVQFEMHHETSIFRANHVLLSVTENLASRYFTVLSGLSDNVYRGSLNYLGGYDPIYLLAGSSIQYIVTTTYFTETTDPTCLYLFANNTYFYNFINSNMNGQETALYCFVLNATQLSYTFEIRTNGVYYVALESHSGFILQTNVSVVRRRYSTTGLEQNCDHSHACNVTVCNTFICTDKSTTYFLIQPANTTNVQYTFSGPRLHGSAYSGFIAMTVLGSLFCCCCYYLFCCIGTIPVCSNDDTDTENNHSPPDALQNRPTALTATAPSRQGNDSSNEHDHSRISHEHEDSFDEDLRLGLYLSRLVNTNSTQEERNAIPPLPSIEEEVDQIEVNELNEHLPTAETHDAPLSDFSRNEPSFVELNEDVDPPKYWDIFNQEEISTNSVEELESTVHHDVIEQSASATIDHNQDRNTVNPLDTPHSESERINNNETESVQQSVTIFDVLMPLPSPLEEYDSLSLHPQEVEMNEHSIAIEEDVLPITAIDKQSEELKSSSSDQESISDCELSMTSTIGLQKLPSDFKKKLDESHAPVILSAIKNLVYHWDFVGLYLGIDNADLEKIKYEHSSDVDHCRKEMIFVWLRCHNATRHRLIKALKEAGRNDIAHKVKGL